MSIDLGGHIAQVVSEVVACVLEPVVGVYHVKLSK